MSLVEPELLSLPEHLSSPQVFGEVRIPRSLVFCVVFRISLFVSFLVAITLSVFFRLTTFEYPFGIFKHFLIPCSIINSAADHVL